MIAGAGEAFTLQGAEYDGDLYEPGEVFGYYARGDNVGVALYRAGGTGTLIGSSAGVLYKGNGRYVHDRGTQKTVKKQGTPYAYNDSLYRLTGTGNYVPIGVTLYNEGTDFPYYPGDGVGGYLRGDDVDDVYYEGDTVNLQGSEYENSVFLNGGYRTVTLQGEMTSEKLHIPGQAVTLNPAQVTTQSVTALTV